MRLAIAASTLAIAAAASAVTNPFTETFDTDADWRNAAGDAPAFVASGGPDGSSFISTTFDFTNAGPDSTPVLFRAQDEFGSSGGAFEGDWISAGVTTLSFDIRHDAPAPLPFFVRIAGPNNFPGAVGLSFVPTAPGQWSTVSIDITEGSSAVVLEGGTYESVFSNVGHLQVGFTVPEGLALTDTQATFDIDNVSIVPSPGGAAALAVAGLLGASRRRRA